MMGNNNRQRKRTTSPQQARLQRMRRRLEELFGDKFRDRQIDIDVSGPTATKVLSHWAFFGYDIPDELPALLKWLYGNTLDSVQDVCKPVLALAQRMEALEKALTEFQSSKAFPNLATLFSDLPPLLHFYRLSLNAVTDLPVANRKVVTSRALVWLFLALKKEGVSQTQAYKDIAEVIDVEEGAVRQRISRFRKPPCGEYQRIEQYLAHNPVPTGKLLRGMLLMGAPTKGHRPPRRDSSPLIH